MRKLLSVTCIVLLVLSSALAVWSDSVNGTVAPDIIPTRQTVFTLPFTVAPPRQPDEAPQAVELYVSTDRGANWRMVSQVKPEMKKFRFVAQQDGEYWYRVQTIDYTGNAVVPTSSDPEMKVLIDTTLPELTVAARITKKGKLGLAWSAKDAYVIPATLILEYQADQDASWKPLAINWSKISEKPGLIQGIQAWPVNNTVGGLVRATVSDQAGNQSIVEVPVQPAHGQAREEIGHPSSPSQQRPFSSPELQAPDHGTVVPPAQGYVSPPIEQQVGSPPAEGRAETAPIAPGGIVPRYVDSSSFELKYGIPTASTQGIVKIDLWGTNDGGQKWTYYGTDLDLKSPIPVVVPADGLYGFRLVIYHSDGQRDSAPRAGDPPQVWIAVRDTSRGN